MRRILVLFVSMALTAVLLTACSPGGPDDELKQAAVDNYAQGVHHWLLPEPEISEGAGCGHRSIHR